MERKLKAEAQVLHSFTKKEQLIGRVPYQARIMDKLWAVVSRALLLVFGTPVRWKDEDTGPLCPLCGPTQESKPLTPSRDQDDVVSRTG